jgi:predicted porin
MPTKQHSHAAKLACASLFCATFASEVQAQSELSIYGRMSLGVVSYSGYGPGHVSGSRMNNFSSRIGFKGSEALGQNLYATFVVETGFAGDTGDGIVASREATVGVEGPFGKLRLGFMLSPLDDLHPIAGPGWVTNVTNDNLNGFWANGYSNLFSGGTAGSTACKQVAGPEGNTNSFAFDNRIGNSIRYDSPNLQNFRLATQFAFGEASCGAWAWSNKLQYQTGQLNAALAWQQHHAVRGAGLNDQILMLAASYQITPQHYVGAWWQTLRYANPGKETLRQQAWGGIYKFSYDAHLWEVAWYRAAQGKGTQTPVFSGIFVGPETAANLYIVGYRYKLSKRTELWSQFAQLRNGKNSGYDLGGSGKAGAIGTMGENPRAIAVGLKHDF